MKDFMARNPYWTLIIVLVVCFLLWAIFAPWPDGFEDVFGRKKIFLNALFNGITLGALYFLVASGFTLIFGLMKNVNLAHGSLYLLGGYIGYDVANTTGWWLLSFVVSFVVVGAMGVLLQVLVFAANGRRGLAADVGHDRYFDRRGRPDAVVLGRRFLSDTDAGLVVRSD